MKFSANKEWSNLVVVVIPGRFCKTFFMFKLINWALETRSQLNRIWVSNCTYVHIKFDLHRKNNKLIWQDIDKNWVQSCKNW
jgi:hypothetical protein